MKFFSADFLFSLRLPEVTRYDQALFVTFGTFGALAIAFWFLRRAGRGHRVRAALWGRCFRGALAFALLGGLWSGLRSVEVPVLGIRFVGLMILLGFLVWMGFLVAYLARRFASESRRWEQEQVKQKYLRANR